MSNTSEAEHFGRAARRHHEDAVYLHDDSRLANADHHYGFAVECALKSLLLRYTGVSMAPKPNGKPARKPWVNDAGKLKEFGHLPELWSDVGMQLRGRNGGSLLGLLVGSDPFLGWSVDDRYTDGAAIAESDVIRHRAASVGVLRLHQAALLAGVIP